jgi:subtilisin family serine protease
VIRILIGILVVVLLGTAAAATRAQVSMTPISNRYLGLYQGSAEAAARAVRAAGGTVVFNHDGAGLIVAACDAPDFAASLSASPGFIDVMHDQQVQWDLGQTAAVSGSVLQGAPAAQAATATVNANLVQSPFDAFLLPIQWNIFRTQTDQAWLITQGSPTIKVAVVDTGICAHQQDLIGKVDTAFSTSFVPPALEVPDTVNPACVGCPPWEDRHGHGTHVASIISSNNFGVAGIAPQVRLRAVKALNATGIGLISWELLGVIYAADTGNDVINCSFGGGLHKSDLAKLRNPSLDFFNRAVNYAQSRGALVVAGSANDGIDLDHDGDLVVIPCQSGAGMCVGGTTFTDALSSFSNHGVSAVNIVAPAGGLPVDPFTPTLFNVLIIGACSAHSVNAPVCAPGDFYALAAGTSLATPMVSGAAALLAGLDPSLHGQPQRLKEALTNTADDLGAPGADNIFSRGRLNTLRAVQSNR